MLKVIAKIIAPSDIEDPQRSSLRQANRCFQPITLPKQRDNEAAVICGWSHWRIIAPAAMSANGRFPSVRFRAAASLIANVALWWRAVCLLSGGAARKLN
jgi:hypothetical protein